MTAFKRNRLLLDCFTSQGKPKKKYATQAEAGAARKRYNLHRTHHVYLCPICNNYHVGIKP